MSTICAEPHHKFHSSHQPLSPKKHLREIDIPPRKLLTRRSTTTTTADMFSDDTILQKFLPHNDSDSDSDDPYSSDHFRMYEFKVRRCTRSRSHDWTNCPFAHPGEKARRRDPRRYHYSGTVCPEYRRGGCSRGDACEFSHGVFECWLHPARYRTEACKDGKNCKRKVCFFAHTPRQLRILPVTSSSPNSNEQFSCNKKNVNKLLNNHNHKSCLFCHCGGGGGGGANSNNINTNNNSIASPTSTLFGMSHFSPPASPPLSPLKPRNGVSVSSLSPYGGMSSHQYHRYKDMLAELLGSFEGLNFNDQIQSSSPLSGAQNLSWLDVAEEQQQQQQQQQFIVSNSSSSSFGYEDQLQRQQLNNILLPTVTTRQNTTTNFNNSNKLFMNDDNKVVGGDVNGWSCPAPDLGWVNELLM